MPAWPTNYYSSATQGGRQIGKVNYPSPFFDLSSTYLPASVKDLYLWCEYYFLTNPLVNSVVSKLSEYPITEILIEHDDQRIRNKWDKYVKEVLFLRSFCIEVGLDYYTFGSAYVSVLFPFVKQLQCRACGKWFTADTIKKHWKFSNLKFSLRCPSCNSTSTAEVKDIYYKNIQKVRLVRWNPKQITVSYNDITGKATYYFRPSPTQINDLTLGIRDTVANTPQIIIEAIKRPENQLKLNEANLYHIKRPSLSSRDTGYGVPILLPVLKDLFYLQTLKRAQEALAAEHIVPFRAVFPQAASAAADPVSNVNLQTWRREIKDELLNWRRDPNYIPVLGFPFGHEQVGGDARALLLGQEIQIWSDMILSGMGVPAEIIRGGLNFSGSNVSLRILENKFLNYITQLEHMLGFVIGKISAYTGWQKTEARFKPFKMADDLQRKMFLLNLNQGGKISDTTLLQECDLDSKTEDKLMQMEAKRRIAVLKEQQLAQADIQGEAMVTQAKHQQRIQDMQMEHAQQEGAPPGASPLDAQHMEQEEQGSMNLMNAADKISQQIMGLAPPDATKYMMALKARSPDLASVVASLVEQKTVSGGAGMPAVAGTPLPEQKPPRRLAPSV